MKTAILLLIFTVACCSMEGQNPSKRAASSVVPVYVSHDGQDGTGSQFVDAVKRALSKSGKYDAGNPTAFAKENGFRLYLKIAILDVASADLPGQHASVAFRGCRRDGAA